MESLTIKSSDRSSTVTFTSCGLTTYDLMEVKCELQAEGFSGSVIACFGYGQPISHFFKTLAAEWQGWSGEKTWFSDGGEIRLDATTDRLGHVSLKVTLQTFRETRLTTLVAIDAGSLADLAQRSETLLE